MERKRGRKKSVKKNFAGASNGEMHKDLYPVLTHFDDKVSSIACEAPDVISISSAVGNKAEVPTTWQFKVAANVVALQILGRYNPKDPPLFRPKKHEIGSYSLREAYYRATGIKVNRLDDESADKSDLPYWIKSETFMEYVQICVRYLELETFKEKLDIEWILSRFLEKSLHRVITELYLDEFREESELKAKDLLVGLPKWMRMYLELRGQLESSTRNSSTFNIIAQNLSLIEDRKERKKAISNIIESVRKELKAPRDVVIPPRKKSESGTQEKD